MWGKKKKKKRRERPHTRTHTGEGKRNQKSKRDSNTKATAARPRGPRRSVFRFISHAVSAMRTGAPFHTSTTTTRLALCFAEAALACPDGKHARRGVALSARARSHRRPPLKDYSDSEDEFRARMPKKGKKRACEKMKNKTKTKRSEGHANRQQPTGKQHKNVNTSERRWERASNSNRSRPGPPPRPTRVRRTGRKHKPRINLEDG